MGSVRFFTIEHYQWWKRYGSTRLRVHNLLRYWPDAKLWRPGDRPDVLVLQKAYGRSPSAATTIFDISDPDWENASRVLDVMRRADAVTCPTEALASVLRKHMGRVVVIPDRHDIAELPGPREHCGTARRVVWFGFHHNAAPLAGLIPTIEQTGVSLTVVSDRNPRPYQWAARPREFRHRYSYRRFRWGSIHGILRDHDVCLVPRMNLRSDQLKSDNREALALLCGVPSARTPPELLALVNDPALRSRRATDGRAWALKHRDCRQSVAELQVLIASLTSAGDRGADPAVVGRAGSGLRH
jgi:hypothetical protein